MISFNQIPKTIRTPFAWLEVNPSNLNNNNVLNTRILVIGQKLSTGAVAANVPTLISNNAQAVSAWGQGSNIASMFAALFANNIDTEKWGIAADDAGGGTQAAGTIVIAGPATAVGTLHLYLGGIYLPIAVGSTDTATAIGDNIVAAITANKDIPLTAVNTTGSVAVTFKHKGLIGNYYSMTVNYASGQVLPTGVTCTITQLTGGATDPTLTSTIAALPEKTFNFIVHPYQNSTAITALENEMTSRWNAMRMLEGHIFGAIGGTVSAVTTYGQTRNSPHSTIFDAGLSSPTPSYLWAAAATGVVADSASIDPARPFTGLPLTGVLSELIQNQRLQSDRNSMLYDGIATHTVAQDGTVLLERVTTAYQTNSAGLADGVYLDVNTPLTVSFLRQDLRERLVAKFSRMKLADNGTRFGAGQAIVTPSIIGSEIIAWYAQMMLAGLVEDMDTFKKTLIVERNQNDPTRVDVQLIPNLVNQLEILAVNISFVV